MEPTLNMSRDDLMADVGLFLGYGRGATKGDVAWTTAQESAIEGCVRSGLRQFYFPPVLPGQVSSHEWSFLRPMATLVIPSGVSVQKLPDDFGGIEGEINIQTPSQVYHPLRVMGEGYISSQHAYAPDTTGVIQYVSVRPVKMQPDRKSPGHELYFWPTTDQSYTIRFQYYILPDYLTGNSPYAYGGAAHAETILESCLAIAEQRLDDSSTVHSAKFMERLTASVSVDRRLKPQLIGYNGDRSDGVKFRGYNRYGARTITYNGVEY